MPEICRWFQAHANLVAEMAMSTRMMFTVFLLLFGQGCDATKTVDPVPCSFPQKPKWPDKPICPPTNLTAADGVQMAWRFAPEIRFHPLEDSLPMDPVEWFEAATLHAPAFLIANRSSDGVKCAENNVTCAMPAADFLKIESLGEATSTTSLFLQKAWLTALQDGDMPAEQKAALIAGAPVDARNRSTAVIVHTMYTEQDGNAWVFNFHPFYAWNGCSNQLLSTQFSDYYDVVEYYMCPTGVHEGDWENIGVYVCPGDLEAPAGPAAASPSNVSTAIRRVQYSQHGWVAEYDCDEPGECPFEDDARSASGLVAYAGLFSHAHYPTASNLWVYSQSRLTFLANMDGIYISDRTAGTAQQGRRWVPSATNVRHVPRAENITANSQDVWALFSGNWGTRDLGVSSKIKLTCLSGLGDPDLGHTQQGECEEGPAFKILKEATGGSSADNTSDAIVSAVASEVNQTSAASRTGPLHREYSYTWLPERPAPIWGDITPENTTEVISSMLVCPASSGLGSNATVPLFHRTSVANFLRQSAFAIAASATLLVLLLLAPTLLWEAGSYNNVLVYTCPQPVTQAASAAQSEKALLSSAHAAQPNATDALRPASVASVQAGPSVCSGEKAFHPPRRCCADPWLFGLYILLTLGTLACGIALTANGMHAIFGALNEVHRSSVWDSYRRLIISALVLLAFCDLILLTATAWSLPSPGRYACVARVPRITPVLRACIISAGCFFLFLQIYTTMALAGVGLLLVVARTLLGVACEQLSGLGSGGPVTVTSVCIDLSVIGLETVTCGSDVIEFCTDWNRLAVEYILWGCFFFIFSHVLLLMFCLSNITLLRLQTAITQQLRHVGHTAAAQAQPDSDYGTNERGAQKVLELVPE